MHHTHTTKSEFGTLLKAGIKCNIVSTGNTSVMIQTESGNFYWGREKDLIQVKIEQGIINACFNDK